MVYNSDKQLLYKLDSNNSLSVIFDEVFYSSLPNRQMRFDSLSSSILAIQTRERDITILTGIEQNRPCTVSKIKGVPGDRIIDFKHFEDLKVVCISNNGFLSCYDISVPEARLLTVKRLFFTENEYPNSLEVNSKFNKICVASLKYEEKMASPQQRQTPNQKQFRYNCVNIFILEYNFVENSFDSKFDKPFRIESDLNETNYAIEMNMENSFDRFPILFMILNKDQSQTLAFLIKDKKMSPVSSYNLKQMTSCYEIRDNELWVLGASGNVKVLV